MGLKSYCFGPCIAVMLALVSPLTVLGFRCEPSDISSSSRIQSSRTAVQRLASSARSPIAFSHSPVRHRVSPGPRPASGNSPRYTPYSMSASGTNASRKTPSSPFSLSRLTVAIMGNRLEEASAGQSGFVPPPGCVPMLPPAPAVPPTSQ